MKGPINLAEVPATHYTETTAFVTRSCCGPDGVGECQAKAEGLPCGIGRLRIPEHDKTKDGHALRERRIELKLSLRQAAEKLGITVVQYGGLERGVYTTDWNEARRRLEE